VLWNNCTSSACWAPTSIIADHKPEHNYSTYPFKKTFSITWMCFIGYYFQRTFALLRRPSLEGGIWY